MTEADQQATRSEALLELTVVARTTEADDVISLRLANKIGTKLPRWEPGAHIDLILDGGLTRQYSLTGPVDADWWQIAVLREQHGRGGSQQIFDTIHEGSTVIARGPRNHFTLEAAASYVFIAGGIGITPIRPMLDAADAAGSDWRLLYGGRSATSMAFVRELTSRYGDRVTVCPQDRDGLLDLSGFLSPVRSNTFVYCCGPEPLLRAVQDECASKAACTVRVERFTPAELPDTTDDSAFEVELAQTGSTINVAPGVSILTAAEEAGAFVTSSCEEGTCGSCETVVLAGVPEHRDSVLNDTQRATGTSMMICVSRAVSRRLVLDL